MTIEYRTLSSLLTRRWSRSHSLSGESPGMRQDFVFPGPSESPLPFPANPAAASTSRADPHPHSPDGTSVPSSLPANSAASERFLLLSAPQFARSHKNNPRLKSLRPLPSPARPAPAALIPALASLASTRPKAATRHPLKAPYANLKLRATREWLQSRSASPAAAQSQIIQAACARACDHPGASPPLQRRAPC